MRPAFRAGVKPALFAGMLALLAACAPTRRAAPAAPPPADSAQAGTRVLYLIHGDADYSYHDSTGRRLHADREAVREARLAGSRLRGGEVFIFHQKRSGGLFRRARDGRFEHYRFGNRIGEGSYTRRDSDSGFEAESRILGKRTVGPPPDTVRLAYFGHEIPLHGGTGYFPSNPGLPFSAARFATALGRLQVRDSGKPYDLIVLSMCYGGNAELLRRLAPLAHRAVASPAYLHLSYLDAGALGEPPPSGLADTLAARSFARLRASTQTEITVAVYDLGQVDPPAPAAPAHGERPAWKDCAELPGFDAAAAARGVRLLYQPPRFGALKHRRARSAWQCAF